MALSNNFSAELQDIILEFEACLAEYNAVREELRARAEAHRRVTEYGLLALGALATALTLVFGGLVTPGKHVDTTFPIHYLLLLAPMCFLYLLSVYVDESLAEYIAQAYVIHVLRPSMRKIIEAYREQCKSQNKPLLFEHLWEWDVFHIAARGVLAGAITGLTRGLTTIVVPIVLPVVLFVIIAIQQKGYLTIWESVILISLVATVLFHIFAMFRVRTQIREQVIKFREGEEMASNPFNRSG